MSKFIRRLVVILLFLSVNCFAEVSQVALEEVDVNPQDMASVKRGAQFFATTCMACHTLKYLRYDKLAQQAGIVYDRMPFNLKLSGISPPDLSLITRWRSPEWVYTYLHSFYLDPTRPTGVNNLVFPNTAMPNIVGVMQGQLILDKESLAHARNQLPQWYDVLILQKTGSVTPEQFDATMTDLVNFLAYAGEPYREEQVKLGWWVIGFLVIFFVFAYLLKQAYWKAVKRSKGDD